MPLVENSAGQFPEPGIESVSEAAEVDARSARQQQNLARQPADGVPEGLPDLDLHLRDGAGENEKAELLKKFITYAITTGQKFGAELDFAPLPEKILTTDKATIAKIAAAS